jgi:hypothetical protein
MSAHTSGPWTIDWYICREGNKELWRVPKSIGPIGIDHNHWAGHHLTVDRDDARLIAAAPTLLAALKLIADYHSTSLALEYVQGIARAAIVQAEGIAL